jgi:hypothetical protein
MPNLTVQAPNGAHFEFETVKTAKGTKDLGQAPILKWDSLAAATEHYGEENILNVLDGTSLRVSFQGIARRGRIAQKSDDDIAKTQVEFKPGTRVVGQPTPVSRAKRAAGAAAEKVDGDMLAKLLEDIANGRISAEDLQALTS